ncbi:MAG TPA: sulfite exporter TauE/SafE family protein, partial [Acidimicrobiales bacterium]|nr:sulfite exporter TauE/SafE family protein [Acidimicrobiales bacterium]
VTPALLAQAADLTALDVRFVQLVDRALANPWTAVVAVVVAVGVGAVHALAPGHAKVVAGAYLLGGGGRVRDALLLGVAVSAMHVVSVLVLGVGLYVALRSGATMSPQIGGATATLRIVSGVMVLALGISMLVRQRRARRRHAHHHHTLPPEVRPFSRRGLTIIGMSGGLLPSPAAFTALTTAAFAGRWLLGVALVAAFSVGLAATLTVIGVLVVRGRVAIDRRLDGDGAQRFARVAAIAGAVTVTAGGAVLTVAGLLAR